MSRRRFLLRHTIELFARLPEAPPSYSRMRLRSGYAHPLGQALLCEALLGARLTVDHLSLSDCLPAGWQDGRVRLLSVHRYGDALVRKWGDWGYAQQTTLSVNACPAERKRQVRADTLAWLAAVPQRENGWSASERQLQALWVDGALQYVEDRFR